MSAEALLSGDLESWATWQTVLDEHIELVSCDARVLDSGGEEVAKVPRRKHRRVDSIGNGLYDSSRLLEVPFPPLEVGQRLHVDITTHNRPVWPGAMVVLEEDDPQDHLEVVVDCPGDQLRWHLSPGGDRFEVQTTETGLRIEAQKVPGWVRLEGAPEGALSIATLRIAWGHDATWPRIGEWYERIRTGVAAHSSRLTELADLLCEPTKDKEQCFEALAEHVTTQVRYEAVEIGPGGWVPSSPDKVLTRGWGDCKDKSLLLSELLAARGIDAHLVLIRLGHGRAPDPSFPSPFWFNHCIVAVDQTATGAGNDLAIDDLVLVDPTDTEGAATWLNAACQDRPALLVDGADSRLIQVPARSTKELDVLTVSGALDASGAFSGSAELRLDGSIASTWVRYLRSRPDARGDEVVTARFARLLPGARITRPDSHRSSGDIPSVRLTASVELDHLAAGGGDKVRIRLPGIQAGPDPRALESRDLPVVVSPGLHLSRWRVDLPDGWCPAILRSDRASTEVGHATYDVRTAADGSLVAERSLQLHTSQVDPGQLDALRQLAVFDSRAARRSIRLRCE